MSETFAARGIAFIDNGSHRSFFIAEIKGEK